MSQYCTMKLFLTAVEYDQAQAALTRIVRRRTFTDGERAAKESEMLCAMRRKDDLALEIRELERTAA